MDLGRLGAWSPHLRRTDDPAVRAAAAELEQAGYRTLWTPAGAGTRGFDIAGALLAATGSAVVATGITSIWATTVDQTAAGFARLEAQAPGRFLLGLGVSHAALVDKGAPGRYARPLAAITDYLGELDARSAAPASRRVLAALSPRMLRLAARASLGTHPYLVTPEMTAQLRDALPGGLVAVEQAVVVDEDPASARAKARDYLRMYLALPNYFRVWLRHGYTEADLAGGGSDRLVDDLVLWGSAEEVASRAARHWAAGADHLAVQVVGAPDGLGLADYRTLAPQLARAAASDVASAAPAAR
ncbi:TIGR03620 family F420-dependent LLM class oxidoreductase [uncultured Jatrophihabitans sp.]|uniref:TIGR03620 family F420-dependent LLM class oxidoreductase n=1 Tax=uncultured Jatrophihabitans sp. TaxID=1610747 RepID=UPI0035CB3E85